MRDYRVGEVKTPKVLLADAVAASSAFPPFLSPFALVLKNSDYTPNSGLDLQREPFTTDIVLTDGGVYDNLGLETVWKNFRTVMVSDGGGKLKEKSDPANDWGRHVVRILEIVDNQVRSLRKRQLSESYQQSLRQGTFWGIRTNIDDYGLAGNTLPCPFERTLHLAKTPTRLKALDAVLQKQIINWGYAVCDAGLRRHFDSQIPLPPGFAYPDSKI
jgi:NTE family protein